RLVLQPLPGGRPLLHRRRGRERQQGLPPRDRRLTAAWRPPNARLAPTRRPVPPISHAGGWDRGNGWAWRDAGRAAANVTRGLRRRGGVSGGAAAGGEVEEVVEHGLPARAQAVVLVLAGDPGAQARQQRGGGHRELARHVGVVVVDRSGTGD